jgi:DNA polymerase-3 subunit epsilon
MIVLDTETTGLLKPDSITMNLQPYITELYAIKLTDDLEFISEIDTFINPTVPIPEHIIKLNGITDEMVADAPKFIDIYQQLVDMFLGEKIAIGHNVSFDLGMLYCELTRLSKEFHFPWPQKWICTVEKSLPIENKRLTLSQLHEKATGKPHDGAHRAKADVHATIRGYTWLMEQGLI